MKQLLYNLLATVGLLLMAASTVLIEVFLPEHNLWPSVVSVATLPLGCVVYMWSLDKWYQLDRKRGH